MLSAALMIAIHLYLLTHHVRDKQLGRADICLPHYKCLNDIAGIRHNLCKLQLVLSFDSLLFSRVKYFVFT